MLVYGALVEAKRLVLERRELRLPGWPERLDGYKIAVLADLHLRDRYSLALARRAVEMALDAAPDIVVLPGDLVGSWKPQSEALVREALGPLAALGGNAIAIPGNHEYWRGEPSRLTPVLDELEIRWLRNETWVHHGIHWIGLDSAVEKRARVPSLEALRAVEEAAGKESLPRIALWHEPDAVDALEGSCTLMISGHSHGGQFRFPGGLTPMHTKLGKRYVRGFYPEASTPLYVSRGVGTTGPPSRFLCPPEVSLLSLRAGS